MMLALAALIVCAAADSSSSQLSASASLQSLEQHQLANFAKQSVYRDALTNFAKLQSRVDDLRMMASNITKMDSLGRSILNATGSIKHSFKDSRKEDEKSLRALSKSARESLKDMKKFAYSVADHNAKNSPAHRNATRAIAESEQKLHDVKHLEKEGDHYIHSMYSKIEDNLKRAVKGAKREMKEQKREEEQMQDEAYFHRQAQVRDAEAQKEAATLEKAKAEGAAQQEAKDESAFDGQLELVVASSVFVIAALALLAVVGLPCIRSWKWEDAHEQLDHTCEVMRQSFQGKREQFGHLYEEKGGKLREAFEGLRGDLSKCKQSLHSECEQLSESLKEKLGTSSCAELRDRLQQTFEGIKQQVQHALNLATPRSEKTGMKEAFLPDAERAEALDDVGRKRKSEGQTRGTWPTSPPRSARDNTVVTEHVAKSPNRGAGMFHDCAPGKENCVSMEKPNTPRLEKPSSEKALIGHMALKTAFKPEDGL